MRSKVARHAADHHNAVEALLLDRASYGCQVGLLENVSIGTELRAAESSPAVHRAPLQLGNMAGDQTFETVPYPEHGMAAVDAQSYCSPHGSVHPRSQSTGMHQAEATLDLGRVRWMG